MQRTPATDIFRLWVNGRPKQWHRVSDVSEGFLDRVEAYATVRERDIQIERWSI